jgi:hypothetical protein
MDRLVKFAILFGAILAGGGVFYHYVVYLPGVEEANRARAEETRQSAARQEMQRQQSYEVCKVGARRAYESDWATACATTAQTVADRQRKCLSDKAIMSNPYMGENYCRTTFSAADPSPNCSLPGPRADGINKTYHEREEKCLAEARLGL